MISPVTNVCPAQTVETLEAESQGNSDFQTVKSQQFSEENGTAATIQVSTHSGFFGCAWGTILTARALYQGSVRSNAEQSPPSLPPEDPIDAETRQSAAPMCNRKMLFFDASFVFGGQEIPHRARR